MSFRIFAPQLISQVVAKANLSLRNRESRTPVEALKMGLGILGLNLMDTGLGFIQFAL